MTPQRKGERLFFSVAEAARILGLNRQTVYAAISTGRLASTGEAYGRKIDVQDLIAYGILGGRDPQTLLEKIKEESKSDWGEIAFWLLAGLGVAWLITKLLGKE